MKVSGNRIKNTGKDKITLKMQEKLKLEAEALLKSNELFKPFGAMVRDGIIVINDKEQVLYWNRIAEKITGYSDKEIFGQNLLKILVPKNLYPALAESFRDFKKTGKGMSIGKTIELPAIRKNGQDITIELSLSFMKLNGRWIAAGIVREITENLKSENNIAKNRKKYSSLNTSIQEGVCFYEIVYNNNQKPVDYRILDGKSPNENISGIEINNEKGRFASDIYKTSTPPYLNEYSGVVKSGKPFTYDIYFSPSDKYFHITAVKTGENNFATIFTDITELKKSEIKFKKSEERFKKFFDLGLIGMAITSPEKGWIKVNKKLCQIFGYPKKELLKKTWIEITHPDDLDKDIEQFNRVLKGDIDGYAIEKRFIKKDGKIIHANISVKCIRKNDGSVDYFTALIDDISVKKKYQEDLIESEEKFQKAFYNYPGAVVIITLSDGRFINVNKSFLRLFKYKKSEVIGRTSTELDLFVDKSDRGRIAVMLGEIDSVRNIELILRTKKGEKKHCNFSADIIDINGQKSLIAVAQDITDLKMAEVIIQTKSAFLDSVIEQSPFATWISDSKGVLQRANPALKKFLNIEDEQIVGKYNILHDPIVKRQGLLPKIRSVFEEGKSVSFTCDWDGNDMPTLNLKGSNKVSIEATMFPIFNPDGEMTNVVLNWIDITKRRKAEEALLKAKSELEDKVKERTESFIKKNEELLRSEQKYKYLIEGMLDGYGRTDMQGTMVDFNPAFAKMIGYTKKEITKLTFQDITPEKWHDMETDIINNQVIKRGFSDIYEKEYKKKNGDIIPVELRAYLLKDEKGENEGFWGIIRDVSARKQIENALRESKDYLELSLKAVRAGTLVYDIASSRLEWDDRSLEIFGISRTEFNDDYDSWASLVHPEDIEYVENEFGRQLKEEPFVDIRYKVRQPDGNLRYINAVANIIKNEKGEPVKLAGLHFDETEKVMADEKLKLTLNELERSNAELQQFAYVASHDLQEPLRMVSSFIQLLQKRYEGQLDKDADEFIGYAVDGVSRMKKLINDLLSFSRVRTKGKPFKKIKLSSLVETVVKSLTLLIESNNAKIEINRLPTINVDESQFMQLFQNLIVNAIKFRSEKDPVIIISAKLVKREWQFSVEDNGIGIETQYHDKVFQIFQRLQSGEKIAGSGIGLSICKRIVERHNGRMWVESEPGYGSTFYFKIPVN